MATEIEPWCFKARFEAQLQKPSDRLPAQPAVFSFGCMGNGQTDDENWK